nr:hypothetical protein HmN_000700200 [Hymenolepis microstoma]
MMLWEVLFPYRFSIHLGSWTEERYSGADLMRNSNFPTSLSVRISQKRLTIHPVGCRLIDVDRQTPDLANLRAEIAFNTLFSRLK